MTLDVEDRIREAYRGIEPSPDLEHRIAALVADAPQTGHGGGAFRPRTRLILVAGAAAAAAVAVVLLRPAPVPTAVITPTAAKTGTIRGVCRLSEDVTPWLVPAAKSCTKGQPWVQGHRTERLVLGEDLALGNCLVGLKDVSVGKEWPKAMRSEDRTATIVVRDGDYRPHVTWIRAGTQVNFENEGTCDNNVHAFFRSLADTQFNFALPPKSVRGNLENAFLEAPGLYILKDDIHPWMNGYIYVVKHPGFDLTSAVARPELEAKAGEFVLTDLPAGEYGLVCWHESMEERPMIKDGMIVGYRYMADIHLEATVTVEAGKTATADFTIPAPPR